MWRQNGKGSHLATKRWEIRESNGCPATPRWTKNDRVKWVWIYCESRTSSSRISSNEIIQGFGKFLFGFEIHVKTASARVGILRFSARDQHLPDGA